MKSWVSRRRNTDIKFVENSGLKYSAQWRARAAFTKTFLPDRKGGLEPAQEFVESGSILRRVNHTVAQNCTSIAVRGTRTSGYSINFSLRRISSRRLWGANWF